ncbi:ATP-dependent DNA helicase RecG, partial [gut metagenome]
MGLPALGDSIRYLHHPPANADALGLQTRTCPQWQRLIFDELLAQQITLKSTRSRSSASAAQRLPAGSIELIDRFIELLPFALTRAQQRVAAEIEADLDQPVPSHRLIQGDVGCGKTVVATLALLRAVAYGHQCSLMAPTEILAEQHYKKIRQWLEPLGVRVTWLTGRLKPAEKREALQHIADGTAQVIVGTHALIQNGVAFRDLVLSIVDEQHRFGVLQRLALRTPGQNGLIPHLLMLSATPIPRTLAMSYLADLNVSVIDELPPGRTPVITKLARLSRKHEVHQVLRHEVSLGRQVYWVCPLIEESESLDLTPATTCFEELQQALPDLTIGLVHGAMSAAEKDATMSDFQRGIVQVLVATTVIEVGVDVPNASLMIIEHAERFGLAQLHQLRGRVGRGASKSACILLYDPALSAIGKERLKIIYESNDGFEIARRDLELRGPGEFLGERQSGMPFLRFADLDRDETLLAAAQKTADRWLRD